MFQRLAEAGYRIDYDLSMLYFLESKRVLDAAEAFLRENINTLDNSRELASSDCSRLGIILRNLEMDFLLEVNHYSFS